MRSAWAVCRTVWVPYAYAFGSHGQPVKHVIVEFWKSKKHFAVVERPTNSASLASCTIAAVATCTLSRIGCSAFSDSSYWFRWWLGELHIYEST